MFIAVSLGLVSGVAGLYFDTSFLISASNLIADLFIKLLKLVSLPIIFLSIVSTASGMESVDTIKQLGKRVLKYTLLTTVISATIALAMFLLMDPVSAYTSGVPSAADQIPISQPSYLNQLIKVIPSNILEPFLENNVIGVLLIAMALSLAMLGIPSEKRKVLNTIFSGLYTAVMRITTFIISLMPIAIWAFITLFFHDLNSMAQIQSLGLYLACVLAANVLQGFVVLPLFLKFKGISPWSTFKAMSPALSTAFFSKSSSGAMPMAIKCANENVGVNRNVANFSLPLCTTINMNGCAAFILITVLFVSMSNGMAYTLPQMSIWVLIATIAAVGNAGVPMGCYFMATAFLVAMDVPLDLLAVILPFYTLIDMLESSINVWSDSCVTVVVDRELKAEEAAASAEIGEKLIPQESP